MGIRIGTIAGFELRVHWSTLIIFGLLTFSLAAAQLPDQAPDASDAAYVVAALIAGAAFYVALLAHEVSHAIVAERNGIEVDRLTLWLLGGLAELRGEPESPGADLRIAGVGPLVSLAFGAIAAGAAVLLQAAGASDLVVATTAWLAGINVILAVFNLIPAAPLDGGRVLRAALWAWRGDRSWAASKAARAGEIFGYTLIGIGLLSLLYPGIGGLWFLVLGWFLINAARAEQLQTQVRDQLGDLPVERVMTPNPSVAPADATVAEVLDDYVLRQRHSAFPLRDADGKLAGLITLERLRSVAPDQRATTPVRSVACPVGEVVTVQPDEPLVDLLPRLNSCGDGRALVLRNGELVGIVTPTDVTRVLDVAA